MATERKRRLAAVWFADVVGYTDLSARDENAALEVVEELRRLSEAAVQARGGRVVKYVGDAALAVFDSAESALEAALALQDAFTDAQAVRDTGCALRTGLHLGEIVEADDGDIYGDGVNIASRIEGQAQAGQIVVSEAVYTVLKQQAKHSFHPFGPVRLKGLEEAMWLYAVGDPPAEVVEPDSAPELQSTWLYGAITRHWPAISLGSAGVTVAGAFALSGARGAFSIESYIFTWGATTAGIWFLFDKAEAAIAAPMRKKLAAWLTTSDSRSAIGSLPEQFAYLFDRVFGERHLTWYCAARSAVATSISIAITAVILHSLFFFYEDDVLAGIAYTVAAVALAITINLLPDYVSLLETRMLIRWERSWDPSPLNPLVLIVVDLVATTLIAGGALWGGIWLTQISDFRVIEWWDVSNPDYTPLRAEAGAGFIAAPLLGFFSTFFTSVWLWLYAASMLVSRVLLRMNDGVGLLLRVTDVQKQPFRSLGFVSVIVVTALFLLGLPLVLL